MALIRCPECGREISHLARACVGCGRTMAEAAPAEENACRDCGHYVSPRARECLHCGRPTDGPGGEPGVPAAPQEPAAGKEEPRADKAMGEEHRLRAPAGNAPVFVKRSTTTYGRRWSKYMLGVGALHVCAYVFVRVSFQQPPGRSWLDGAVALAVAYLLGSVAVFLLGTFFGYLRGAPAVRAKKRRAGLR